MIHPKQAMQAAGRKIANMLARGIVKIVSNGLKTQAIQLSMMADESRDNLEHPQEYGFTSYPVAGAEAIAAFFGGNRDHGTVLVVFDKRYRPTDLEAGEVCLYDNAGTKIVLKSGNRIEMTASSEVLITAPTVTVTGNLLVQGDITDTSGSNSRTMAGMRTVYNGHTHPENGGTTSAPSQGM